MRIALLSWLPPFWAIWFYTVVLRPTWLRRLAHGIIKKMIPERVEISGVFLALNRDDAIVSGAIALGCYENYLFRQFQSLIRPGMTVLDVGANIGLYSAPASKRVGQKGRVVAVEPDAESCRILAKTRAANNLQSLVIVQKAAGRDSGAANLFLNPLNKADHRLYDPSHSRLHIPIETVRGDDLCSQLDCEKVDLIKIDTQGFESFVIEGFRQTLVQNHDIILFMEFWPWGITESGCNPQALVNSLLELDFQIYEVDEDRGRIVPARNLSRLIGRNLEREHTNLYLQRGKPALIVGL